MQDHVLQLNQAIAAITAASVRNFSLLPVVGQWQKWSDYHWSIP